MRKKGEENVNFNLDEGEESGNVKTDKLLRNTLLYFQNQSFLMNVAKNIDWTDLNNDFP